jgi:flagellar biosynthesis regulator FlbT
VTFARQIATDAYYPALMTCRDIIAYEEKAFSRLLRASARG